MKTISKLALAFSVLITSSSVFAAHPQNSIGEGFNSEIRPSMERQHEAGDRPPERMRPPKFMEEINMGHVMHKILTDCNIKGLERKEKPKDSTERKFADTSEKLTKSQCEFFKDKKAKPNHPDFEIEHKRHR